MIDPIKVGVGLSGTIASHKTLTLVVGMTMILDDFLRQCMLHIFQFNWFFVLQYCFRHYAFCNLDWGITIYYHFKFKKNSSIPQDIDTSCRYDNDPRWFPQAMYVTESHHIVQICIDRGINVGGHNLLHTSNHWCYIVVYCGANMTPTFMSLSTYICNGCNLVEFYPHWQW
jgi:hypothetical protein